MRWKIETAYETLKDRLQLENFTGTKPRLLEQDIYSTIYVSNLAEDIIADVEEQQKDHLANDYKHTMQINRSVSIGLLKSDLIYLLIEPDPAVKEKMLNDLCREISENIVPIREDRHYRRTKGVFKRHDKPITGGHALWAVERFADSTRHILQGEHCLQESH